MTDNVNSKLLCDRAYEKRQKAKGIRVRGFRLTDEEWQKVKEFIKQMRSEKTTIQGELK